MKYGIWIASILMAIVSVQKSVQAAENPPITFSSLLEEMVSRDALARFPEPAYTCKQFSSYDRHSDTPDSPTWWANMDRSYFLRTEEKAGKKEYVLMDTAGPGAVVRFWATWHGPSGKPFTNGILRFYLDGNEKPAIEGPIQSVLDEGMLTGAPLSEGVSPQTQYGQRGHNLYLPIPYARHCKITYQTDAPVDEGAHQGEALYYQINYRTYAAGTAVQSFSMDQLETAKSVLAETQKKLSQAVRPEVESRLNRHVPINIPAGGSSTRALDSTNPQAIVAFTVKLKAGNLPQALRSTVLEMIFDDTRTVWCPVGDFFGIGYNGKPYKTWYTEVTEDGTMSCYWPMPYQRSVLIKLHNLGDQIVRDEKFQTQIKPWTWDNRSMYFHAAWKQWTKIQTCSNTKAQDHGAFDLNWVKVAGQGVYVGDSLAIFNGAAAWWGEGDEKIYVDGETFPSHFGTGTEDYYGYAWCRPEYFQSAFHAQPSGTGNLDSGFSVNVRYRALDAIPFTRALQFDMELWHWARTRVNYAPATFWYARPGATANVQPMPEEARSKVALVQEDVVEIKRVKGALEGEAMQIRQNTGGKTELQSGAQFDWSGGKQLWWIDAKEGDTLILDFSVDKAGLYAMTAALTKANDYGIIAIAVNGKPLAEKLDLYNPAVITEEIALGTCQLKQGVNQLEVKIIGSNPEAIKRNMFGLDYILLTPQN
ncbi:MAG: DUF2961 domain-containing protein [Sedimentisphaerales bacterium]|nr:DUF2961 domain-containing protein [Sedimentisphaerales bacterium]